MGAAVLVVGVLVVRGLPRTDAVRSAPAMVGPWRVVTEGFRAAAADRATSLVLTMLAAQSTVRGALGVLLVLIPLEVLGLGASGVGLFNAVLGLGAFVGAVAVTGLAGRRSLAGPMGLGLLLTGVPLLAAALVTLTPVVVVAITVIGVGSALLGVTGSTLLVRSARDDVLARVIGVQGTVRASGIALGAGLTPLVVALVGLRGVLAVLGVAVVVAWAVGRSGLRAIDRASSVPEQQLQLLQEIPMFASLSPTSLERLATRLEPVEVDAGTAVVREGDVGDSVLLVADGELAVHTAVDGQVDLIGPGEVFGEMALVENAPRNATVRALTGCSLYRLTREEFLAAITGNPASARQVQELVGARLAARAARAARGERARD